MLKFIWDTDLETENLLIDSQHKEIFNRVNNLISAISIGKGKEETRKILSFLSSYVVYHFEAEENYMKISEYSDLDIHIMEHKQFINEINNIRSDFETNEDSSFITEILLNKLYDWLINHIGIADKQFAKYLKEKEFI
ncbi:MAG TPA: bacteriohemerythrin [Bacteroidota bacterium]|jgi:hemerythrin|nr:bacteriohemerythrin [Bacteroidota bacterium]